MNFKLAYTDTKGTGISEDVKNFAMQVMKDTDENTRKPVHCGCLLNGIEIPENIRDFVKSVKGNPISAADDTGELIFDAWKHRDDDINNLFTYRLETLYGVKNITYKNVHPTKQQIESIREEFDEFYKNEIFEGESEDSICCLIAMEVADYVLGEDFLVFFNENLNLLHDDMREAFLVDARAILDELKASIN